jgi:hypothetical protein
MLSLSISTAVLFLKASISALPLYATMSYLLLTLGLSGGLMENQKWMIPAEYARIILALPIALLFWEQPYFNEILRGVSILTLLNLLWFSRVVKHIRKQGDVRLV